MGSKIPGASWNLTIECFGLKQAVQGSIRSTWFTRAATGQYLLILLRRGSRSHYSITNTTEEEHQKYNKVLGKFDSFSKVINVIYTWPMFFNMSQQSQGTAEHYIMSLYDLTKMQLQKCWSGNYSLSSPWYPWHSVRKTSAYLKFTLKRAKKAIWQKEAICKLQQALKDPENLVGSINAVGKRQLRAHGNLSHRSKT